LTSDLPELTDFYKIINSPNELTLFVIGHLMVEFMIEQLIKRDLESPDIVLGNNTRFANKLLWLESIGILKGNHLSNIKIMNEIRNKFAHNLKPDDEKMQEKINSLIPIRVLNGYEDLSSYDKYRTVVIQIIDDLQKAIKFNKPLGES